MKKATLTVFVIVFMLTSFAAVPVNAPAEIPKIKASEIMIPIGGTGKQISLLELSAIRLKELETLTGKKMSYGERLAFPLAQRKLRKTIQPDGTINNKRLARLMKKETGPSQGFHALGFILGFFLGPLGVLLAYLINSDEDKRNRVKWSWIGFGLNLILSIIILAAWVSAWNTL
jgi:hypothetical protein